MEQYFYFFSQYSQIHIETWFMTEDEARNYAQEQGFVYQLANQ